MCDGGACETRGRPARRQHQRSPRPLVAAKFDELLALHARSSGGLPPGRHDFDRVRRLQADYDKRAVTAVDRETVPRERPGGLDFEGSWRRPDI